MSTRAVPKSVDRVHPQRAKPFHRDGWVYEEKYDSWRIVAFKDGSRVRLVSRTGRDHASRFAELAQAIAALPVPTVILDGEVCRFDDLVSRFHLLSDPDGHALATPAVFVAFDCLHLGGRDLRPRPLVERRRALEEVIDGHEFLYVARRLADDGLKAWELVKQYGYEGLVAKDARGPYDSPRTRWFKVKVRHEGRFLVGGVIRHARYFILQAGREPLDADALSADSRAHRAARVAPDVIKRTAQAENRVDAGVSVSAEGGRGVARSRRMRDQQRWRRENEPCHR